MNKKTYNIYEKYNFTEKELREKADELSDKLLSKEGKEEQLKSVKSQFKAEIEGFQAQIIKLSNDIRSKYEYRYFKCFKKRDIKRKINVFVCSKTGAIMKESPFTDDDYQMEISDQVKEDI